MRPRDTSPEAWKVFLDLQRRMTPSEKMERVLELSDRLRGFVESGVRATYPEADEHEIFLRVTRLVLGPEMFRRAYGDPLSEHAPEERT